MKFSFLKKTPVRIVLVSGILFLFLFNSGRALAQNTNSDRGAGNPNDLCDIGGPNCYELLTPLPVGGNEVTQTTDVSNPLPYIQAIAEVLISLGIVVAVFFIVYGGIIKMTTDNVENHKEGNKIIQRTIVGLLLLAFSYLLLTTIDPSLITNPFTEIQVPGSSTSNTPTNSASNNQ